MLKPDPQASDEDMIGISLDPAGRAADRGRGIPLRRRHCAHQERDPWPIADNPWRRIATSPATPRWCAISRRSRRLAAPTFPTAPSTPTWSPAPSAATRSARAASPRWRFPCVRRLWAALRAGTSGRPRAIGHHARGVRAAARAGAEFLCEEGNAALRRSAPVVWAFMRSRGLLAAPQQQHNAPTIEPAHGFVRVVE